ncbi:hypothetical protein P4E94_18465 [Pontiellaceae bacterium B12219]|nr:hypothetical protein [Pontiellaceae bacterium B12219]
MTLTSITLENFTAEDLATSISTYLLKKGISSVVISYSSFDRKKKEDISLSAPNQLNRFVERSIEGESLHFVLDIPEIKTTFEKFTYGIEANSHESDFLSEFGKFS